MNALIDALPNLAGKACFTAYTAGSPFGKLARSTEARLTGRGARIVGGFKCRGYDTFGPLRFVGGIARKHPSAADIDAFLQFLEAL